MKIYPGSRFDNIFVYFACLAQIIKVWGASPGFDWALCGHLSKTDYLIPIKKGSGSFYDPVTPVFVFLSHLAEGDT